MPLPFRRRQDGPSRRVHRTDVGSVPCFWAEAPPPFTATLVFRVGRADEQLHLSGITHLAEHLLMPASPPRDVDRNARVEDVFAAFWATGREVRVLRFLEETAAAAAAPPLERIDIERKILQTEGAGGRQGPVGSAMALRYGAQGHGLAGYDEFGLEWIGANEVAAWVRERFTSGNAALWMTGRPPRELELALPPGDRLPPPEATALADLTFPSVYTEGPAEVVSASFQTARSAALTTGFGIVVDRAWKTLRYELGLAYEIGDWYEPLTGELAHGTVWVDCLEPNLETVGVQLLSILDDVGEKGPTAEELSEEVERFAEQLVDPETVAGALHFAATEYLFDRPFQSEEELLERRRALTLEEVAAAVRAAAETLLVAVPAGTPKPQELASYPLTASASVGGTRYRARGVHLRRGRRAQLVVGDEGITVEDVDGERATVRFEHAVLLQHWPDGSRTLWGRDGFRVHVDPKLWRDGKRAVETLDAKVPAELAVVMERALADRIAEVDAVAAEKLKRRWVVTEELDALPGELQEDERLLTLAEANRGFRPGLLAVTDRRLLWLYRLQSERRLELSLGEIESIRRRRGVLESKVIVHARGEKIDFGDVVPRVRAAEIVELVEERSTRTSPAPG